MSAYTPIIRSYRLRAELLQRQADQLADLDMTAARVLRGIAVVDDQVADNLEREDRDRAERVKPIPSGGDQRPPRSSER